MLEFLKRIYRSLPIVRRTANRFLGRRIHDPTVNIGSRFLGSRYGGWAVPLAELNAASTVYSFGVGQDVTFDLALIELVGCEVNAFDPTPLCTEWIERQKLPPQFRFHKIGVAAVNGEVDFFYPDNDLSHSFSKVTAPDSTERRSVKGPVRTVSTLMKSLGHESVDLCKFDIEGFEFEVVDDLILTKVRPRLLLVEFHHSYYGITKASTLRSVQRLRDYGYDIYWISDLGLEYGFIDTRGGASADRKP
jgi:FkbM family methyltransferase